MKPSQTPFSGYNLTAEELALKLGYTVQYVRQLAASGKIPGVKRIRQWMFNEEEVFEVLKSQTEQHVNENQGSTNDDGQSTKGGDLLR